LLDLNGYIRLTDFGLSKQNAQNMDAMSVCGTNEYLAPEILLKQGHGKPADWWTFGSIIYELITGMPAFHCKTRNELFEKIKREEIKVPNHISNNMKDLLQKLFKKAPDQRIGFNGAEEVKSHPWFEKVDWEALETKKIQSPFVPKVNSKTDVSNFDTEFTECEINSF